MTLLKLHRQLSLNLYSLDLILSAFWVRSLQKDGLIGRLDSI
ncbi:MAG: hypothetical protein RMY16_05435 [Nostoc sp. DedQUE12b]|nr:MULTISPECIES: hypothetical protein [unclassified Nostoc]MDZ7949906.1 hypothetical protein [Nostoc sp. DedQUE09]MDZ8085030.1 hypothetical protein [Nostoc sp. DedQUE12b]